MILRTIAACAGLLLISNLSSAATAFAKEGADETDASSGNVGNTLSPPLVNWSVPQFLDGAPGVTSSLPAIFASKGGAGLKTERSIAVFTAIPPCRLVDTRNVFSPAIVSPGPFASGEIRTYTVANLCGLPAASKGLKAVSIAITKIPLGSSPAGDIETVPTGTPLGNTVDMVVENGLWSSVSKIVRVNVNGAFDMQMRNTSGHVAIDVNGYFIDTSTATSADFYSIRGSYSPDPGGLLYSENSSATGAAMRGLNSGGGGGTTLSDVLLSSGTNAIDILEGQIRVRGAGNGTSTPAFIHVVGAGNLCTDTRYTRLDEAHVSPPNSSAGQMLFVQEAAHTGSTDTTTPKAIRTVFLASFNCNGTLLANSWYLFTNGAFANNETYNVLLINP